MTSQPPKPEKTALKFLAPLKHLRISRFWRRSLLVLLSFWLVISVWQAPTVNQGKAQSQELRGVWITNLGAALMYYTTRLDEVVANLANHHLNTIYPAVWNRGSTLHKSAVAQQAGAWNREPLTTLPLVPFTDVLSGLVNQAHRQHLRLIPWFEYGLMIPTNSGIAKKHPDWLTTTESGEKGRGWLNPFHPKVQQFLTDLIVDVVKRYPVDGIQLDDHFGLPVEFGYDSYTAKLYRAEHGNAKPPSNPNNPEWVAWRAKRITKFMGKISSSVKGVRKDVVVSLSPNSPDFAYRNYLQDWRRWVELGLVDEVIVQVYRPNLADLESELDNGGFSHLRQKVPISIGLYTGPFLNSKPIQKLQTEVKAVQKANYNGVSFFCWETTFWFFKGGTTNQVQQTLIKLFPK